MNLCDFASHDTYIPVATANKTAMNNWPPTVLSEGRNSTDSFRPGGYLSFIVVSFVTRFYHSLLVVNFQT